MPTKSVDVLQASSRSSILNTRRLLLEPVRRDRGVRAFHDSQAEPERVAAATTAVAFLDRHGYFSRSLDSWKDITLADILAAIKKFQAFVGLKRSSQLDPVTLKVMQMPRCGCPDLVPEHHPYARFRKAVRAALSAWRKRSVRVVLAQPLQHMPVQRQLELIRAGLATWIQHGNIDAVLSDQTSGADIVIGCGRGRQAGFDGPSNVLAWANLPMGNDARLQLMFDADENWLDDSANSGAGIYYSNVLHHELGHIWGLDHSRVSTALMAATYNVRVRHPQPNDDIPRFQARYGKRTAPLPSDPTPTTPTEKTLTIKLTGDVRQATILSLV